MGKGPLAVEGENGQVRGPDGAWLESEGDKVDGLVRDLFGEEAAQDAIGMGEGEECPHSTDCYGAATTKVTKVTKLGIAIITSSG